MANGHGSPRRGLERAREGAGRRVAARRLRILRVVAWAAALCACWLAARPWGGRAEEPAPVKPRSKLSVFGETLLGDGLLGESRVRPTTEPNGPANGGAAAVAARVADDQLDLRLRLAWGGGEDRAWQGTVRIQGGRLSEATALGREADESSTMASTDDGLSILQTAPRSYSGFDVRLTGDPGSEVTVELAPRDRPQQVKRVRYRLSELMQQTQSVEIDERRNRLVATRAPGDRLRVKFERESLVFSPGEELQLEVTPYETGFEAGANLRLKARLLKARSDDELWRTEQDVRIDEAGGVSPVEPIAVRMPAQEGVYDVELTLAARGLPGGLNLGLSRATVRRSLQVVVVDTQAESADRTPWKVLAEVDSTQGPFGAESSGKWTDWLTRLPAIGWSSGFASGPLGNGKAARFEHLGRPLVQLAPDGWQAYPLPIERTNEPHVLEVEYPSDLAQTLAISVIEPNAAGKVAPIGLDSGLDVADPAPGETPRLLRHRIVFWPRTRTPLVLLANRRADGPAVFGKLAVLAGPRTLPPAPVHGRAVPEGDRRLIAAFFDRPIFPENFGADKSLDSTGEGAWDDWATFWDGGRRFVEYLKYAGYNAAVVTVACEGSALYPSRRLNPTPKYDSGAYFSNGADPVRKDVLEMLLRLFDREGLTLIPAVQFASPLPELEALRRAGGEEATGLEWIGGDGQSWTARNDTNRGLGPYYNPLHPQVRRAMADVVGELEERYSHHESFGGLALQLGPDSYVQLPGEAWGLDDATIERFAADMRVRVPGLGPMKYAQRQEFLLGEGRAKWLEWRSRELAETHRQLHAALARRNPKLKLYLASSDVLTSPTVQSRLRPTLPNRPQLETALLAVGLDPERYQDGSVVLLRPQRSAPLVALAGQGANLEMQRSIAADRLFSVGETVGVHWFHESLPLALPSFDAASPFGPENTRTWLATHATPAGTASRMRLARSLATLDAQVVFDGGWLLPLGAEDDLRSLYDIYRHLPRDRFQTVQPADPSRSQPLTVRTLSSGRQTYVYVVNDSPWNCTGQLDLKSASEFRALPVGASAPPKLERQADGWKWSLRLAPYEVQAALLTAPQVSVTNWEATVDPQLKAHLGGRIQDLRTRANRLRAPQPYDVLKNPGFETPAPAGTTPHWLHAQGAGVEVSVDDRTAHGGRQSLRMRSQRSVVWLRSPPFATPTTGRLAVWAWIKVAAADVQPPLRLAIEGRLDGRTYYRFATVGGPKSASPLQTEWTQYWFQIDDLPVDGLTDLRVGFDLMGPGEVWLDDVQIFDLWFYDNERDELIKNIGLADFNLSSGQLTDCDRFLDGYWPQFLRRHVPREPLVVRQEPKRPVAATADSSPVAAPPDEAGTEKTSWKNRVNGLLPKKMRQ